MKKTVMLFIVAALVLATLGFWIFSGPVKVGLMELVSAGIIIVLVSFALFLGFRRMGALQKGEPAEDEMSKKVMLKSSSLSYYISLYWWLVLGYFSGRLPYEMHTIIGTGILGMAVIFGLCWLFVNFRGISHE